MRIVLAGLGSRGDVQPLVALGLRLHADGHQVVIATSPVFADWVHGHGLEFAAVGGDIEALLRGFGGILVRHPTRAMKALLELARSELDLQFQHTHRAASGADIVVSGVHPAAPSVAEALGVPHRTLLFCPHMLPSTHHAPLGALALPLPSFGNRLLWKGVRLAFNAAFRSGVNRHRKACGLAAVEDMVSHLISERAMVASDSLLGELPADAPEEVVQTGALVLPDPTPLDPALERFLAAGEVPVYIGFGSMPDDDPLATTRTLVEALQRCGRRGVILSGWAGLGGDVPDSVFVARSVNHARLLPRAALAVHHGGAGTTAAVARAGIPQTVVPHLADQFYWGRQVHTLGLGSRPIPRPSLTARRLANAIEEVLSRPEHLERARKMKSGLALEDGVEEVARRIVETAEAPTRRAAA